MQKGTRELGTIARMRKKAWIFLLTSSCLAGCMASAPPSWLKDVPDAEAVGVYHKVAPGQTLFSICRIYGADPQEIAEVNGIDNPNEITAGQLVFIPDASAPKAKASESASRKDLNDKHLRHVKGMFIWPVDGVLTSRFGIRHGRRHDGIDIGAPRSTPIRASAKGKVLYVGQQRGYGNLVIIRHEKNYITVYAHNSKNLVKEGQEVKQGQVIAEVGQTGRATGPHVHFEIRERTKPRNPLFFLPRNN